LRNYATGASSSEVYHGSRGGADWATKAVSKAHAGGEPTSFVTKVDHNEMGSKNDDALDAVIDGVTDLGAQIKASKEE